MGRGIAIKGAATKITIGPYNKKSPETGQGKERSALSNLVFKFMLDPGDVTAQEQIALAQVQPR